MRGNLDVCGQLKVPYDELLYALRKQEEERDYGRN